jgi:signal transduction histidine kinase
VGKQFLAPFGSWGRPFVSFARRTSVHDVLLATILTATALFGALTDFHVDLPEGGSDEDARAIDGLGIVLVCSQTLPLVWRRRAPVTVLWVVSLAMFAFFALGYLPSIASIGFLVALYSEAAYREPPVSILGCVWGTAVLVALQLVGPEPFEPDTFVAGTLVVVAAWSMGDTTRIRRGQVVRLEDRAIRLEREGEAAAAKAVAAERRVIARELHDVVAHNVSVIVAQSGAAQRIGLTHPADALASLGAIERTGRATLVEMRRLMALLRTDTGDAGTNTPQPGVDELPSLVDRVRDAGMVVTLRVEGPQRPLPAGLGLSAFRIVQEALTNVLKHAAGARAWVTVRYEPTALLLSIEDDGVTSDRHEEGSRVRYGHLGMRERVALFGGWLRTEEGPSGGFLVVACLPLDQEPA